MSIFNGAITFYWHSFWLTLAETFSDKNAVLPGLILLSGGGSEEIGYLTAIMAGVPLVSQLGFSGFLLDKPLKKHFLIFGIFLRVTAFFGVAFSIAKIDETGGEFFIYSLLGWMSLFAISGAFAGISYNDLVGKIIPKAGRRKFFVTKQLISSIGVMISAIILKGLLQNWDYPKNYLFAFFLAGTMLFIGITGYFFIKEKPTANIPERTGFRETMKEIFLHFGTNRDLQLLIVISNLSAFTITLIPFYVSFAKQQYEFTTGFISNLIILQIIGMVVSNFIWNWVSKKKGIKGILVASVYLNATLPIVALVLGDLFDQFVFSFLFILVGAAISANKIAIEGSVIELSNESNRVLFSGIFGSLSIVTIILPLLINSIVNLTSFSMVFAIFPIITLGNLLMIPKLKCPVDIAKETNL